MRLPFFVLDGYLSNDKENKKTNKNRYIN